MRLMLVLLLPSVLLPAADLPVKKVVLYKNGVAYYERSGETKAGEPARLEFKASEMDDVLKSLVVGTSSGGVTRVRYDLNEPLQKRLADTGIQLPPQQALAVLLDQWRGSRIDLRYRGGNLSGTILGARLAPQPNNGQRQEMNLLLDSGEIQLVVLEEASALKLADARLQQQLKDALAAMDESRSKDKRSLVIDTTASGAVSAHYLVPAPVWKSSYRLTLPDTGEATLEGWAIVDNDSGEDWNNVDLTVVSGKPVSFISNLYEPRYVRRPTASLPEEQPAAPVVYEGAMDRAEVSAVGGVMPKSSPAPAPPMRLMAMAPGVSSVAAPAQAKEAGELFEYHFSSPVTASKNESLLLPFLQQKIQARRLLVYSDRSSPNPRAAAEISNTSGKTLDGGPITVYQAEGYAGEALMETLKTGDKRLISYAVDLGTRVTTNFDSSEEVIREIKAHRGVLTTHAAVETTTTYTVRNVDAKAKTLVIEHPVDPGQKLLRPQAAETTANHYRFNLSLPANGTEKLAVVQERTLENSAAVLSLTPDILLTYVQNRSLSAAARKQLEAVAEKKNEIATTDEALKELEAQMNEMARDEERLRQNLAALGRVSGQQEQVQRYAGELTKMDAALAQSRDRQAELRKKRAALDAELDSLVEKLEF
jgi:hypothetical protein